jgi:OFA family oxalate/formate antiporter-like MFS transporter
VATLSIFVEPLTREFGWSRAALSGAVSVAGVLAALLSPLIGPLLDRHGSRLVLCGAVLVNATVLVLLSFTPSLLIFYLLFCIGRISWAVPFDLGIYGAIRGLALSAQVLAQAIGPLLAGALRDITGDYGLSLNCFAVLAGVSVMVALAARPPRPA